MKRFILLLCVFSIFGCTHVPESTEEYPEPPLVERHLDGNYFIVWLAPSGATGLVSGRFSEEAANVRCEWLRHRFAYLSFAVVEWR